MSTSTAEMSARKLKEHEEFKERLVDEVFGHDTNGKVHMEKVTMLIWQFRDDARVVQFLAQFVAKYSGSRDVFDGIEFYLPQIAHMIIHLEANWDDAILERFALVISQQSLHFALQLYWILQAALEDYQPETSEGKPNAAYNPLFYTRCVKLLSNMERCVVYGTPRTRDLQRMYERGKISKEEYELLELADRKFNALEIQEGTDLTNEPNGGYLLYKRRLRRSAYRRKPWKRRYFSVSERMLYCYNEDGGKLVRAMPLEGGEISTIQGKYQFMFEVKNQHYLFRMRAESEEDRKRWIELIQEQAATSSIFDYEKSSHGGDEEKMLSDLTPSQRSRYEFYKGERDFVRDLCDVAESLRFEERSERKKFAPGLVAKVKIPPCAYVPMCNSTDVFRRVGKAIAKETRVFNTKERCPTMMYFLTRRSQDMIVDVADLLREKFDIADTLALTSSITEGTEEIGASVNEDTTERSDADVKTVWRTENQLYPAKGKDSRGNRQVQKFMKEHVLQILPKKIASQIEERKLRTGWSMRDMGMSFQSVRIAETPKGDGKATSERCFAEDDGIDPACLERAKALICGGELFSEQCARMLTDAEKEEVDTSGDKLEIVSVIVKSNDDLRQEVFIMQMIHYYKSVFINEGLPIWLHTYRILSTSKSTGFIELITNSTSIDGLKKANGYPTEAGLLGYYKMVFGEIESVSFQAAQRNFMLSLVGYSIISYLLGLKDRHNGNIMIDIRGHIIHIDFGFAFGMAPGHEFHIERAPFKLTKDYLDVLGGENSACFAEFRRLFLSGFEAARNSSLIALGLVEIMMYKSNFPCFSGPRYGGEQALRKFESRLMLDVPEKLVKKKALALIDVSINNSGTAVYDKFQYHSNGYLP